MAKRLLEPTGRRATLSFLGGCLAFSAGCTQSSEDTGDANTYTVAVEVVDEDGVAVADAYVAGYDSLSDLVFYGADYEARTDANGMADLPWIEGQSEIFVFSHGSVAGASSDNVRGGSGVVAFSTDSDIRVVIGPYGNWDTTPLVGTWDRVDELDQHVFETFEFRSDATYTMTDADGQTETGTWSMEGSMSLSTLPDGSAVDRSLTTFLLGDHYFGMLFDAFGTKSVYARR